MLTWSLVTQWDRYLGSFEPFSGVNSIPNEDNQHYSSVNKRSPIHCGKVEVRAPNCWKAEYRDNQKGPSNCHETTLTGKSSEIPGSGPETFTNEYRSKSDWHSKCDVLSYGTDGKYGTNSNRASENKEIKNDSD